MACPLTHVARPPGFPREAEKQPFRLICGNFRSVVWVNETRLYPHPGSGSLQSGTAQGGCVHLLLATSPSVSDGWRKEFTCGKPASGSPGLLCPRQRFRKAGCNRACTRDTSGNSRVVGPVIPGQCTQQVPFQLSKARPLRLVQQT